jgi:hypothetical protein
MRKSIPSAVVIVATLAAVSPPTPTAWWLRLSRCRISKSDIKIGPDTAQNSDPHHISLSNLRVKEASKMKNPHSPADGDINYVK